MILVVIRYHVFCDKCRVVGPEASTVDEVRHLAEARGWKPSNLRGEPQDLCPDCVRAEQPQASE